jgi:hypothetical protein
MATNMQGMKKAEKTVQRRRLIIALEGRERSGKTTFALSAPGPILYFPLDPGREGVLDKVLDEKDVYLPTMPDGTIDTYDYHDATKMEEWSAMWERFKLSFMRGLKNKDIRTVIVDTMTEAWELLRLAKLGKLTQVMPHQYGPVNAEFRALLKEPYRGDKNVIFIHKVKAEYINDKRTGNMERQGFSDVGYQVQIEMVTTWNQDDGFGLWVRNCRQNMEAAGLELPGPLATFPQLAMQVFPMSEESEWV